MTTASAVAIVLPPGQAFSSQGAGPISLMVQRLAAAEGGSVIGSDVAEPFPGIDFRPVPWRLLRLSAADRYRAGVARLLRRLRPELIKVHDQPGLALRLARRYPRVTLFLHRDPGQLGASNRRQRQAVLDRVRVVAVSRPLHDRMLAGVEGAVTVLPSLMAVPRTIHRVRQKLILFIGRYIADDGADAFVDACGLALRQLPGWRAEMIDTDPVPAPPTPDSYIEGLQRRAARVGVVLSGHVPHAEAMERLSRAAIALVPSRLATASGLPALEAMAHGAALVCSRRGELAQTAGDAALYAEPEAAGGFASAVLALAADPVLREDQVARARRRALKFDTGEIVRIVRRLRSDVLGASALSSPIPDADRSDNPP